jgi:hypothetical protein
MPFDYHRVMAHNLIFCLHVKTGRVLEADNCDWMNGVGVVTKSEVLKLWYIVISNNNNNNNNNNILWSVCSTVLQRMQAKRCKIGH